MQVTFGQQFVPRHKRHPHLDYLDAKPEIKSMISPFRYNAFDRDHKVSNPVVVTLPGYTCVMTVKRVGDRPNIKTLAEGNFVDVILIKNTSPGHQSNVRFPLKKDAVPAMHYSEDHSSACDAIEKAWKSLCVAVGNPSHIPSRLTLTPSNQYMSHLQEIAQILESAS